MDPVALKEKVGAMLTGVEFALTSPTVLVAAVDFEIRNCLTELFRSIPVNPIWVKGVEAAKSMMATRNIAACLCGLWLQDGTYRELVRHIRRKAIEIPTIIISTPGCSLEYKNYLAAMNMGALDFLEYPYKQIHLETKLKGVLEAHARTMQHQSAV